MTFSNVVFVLGPGYGPGVEGGRKPLPVLGMLMDAAMTDMVWFKLYDADCRCRPAPPDLGLFLANPTWCY